MIHIGIGKAFVVALTKALPKFASYPSQDAVWGHPGLSNQTGKEASLMKAARNRIVLSCPKLAAYPHSFGTNVWH